ncbi:tape measure protein [Lactococcus lactis]|nr:tape measure protein [Lactococcus lactis]
MDIAKGVGVFKILEVGINAVTNSVGAAVSRFDTLNQYPKVLQSLGASAEDSDRGIQILSDGIDGLPTKLDDVAATSQQMFLVFRDADKASESTIALNNALLASGSSGDKAARGTEAYLKMLRSGKVDMDTWMSLQDTMGIGLDKVAKEMLGAEASTTDLYQALQSGQISVDDFNGALVGMSDELGDLARVNTKGIGTSFSNMANAISKGVGNTIQALDDLVKASGINADGIAGIFDVLKAQINKSFTAVNKAIVSTAPYISKFIGLLGDLKPLIPPLTVGIAGLATAFGTMKIVNTVNNWMKAMNANVLASKAAFGMYNLSLKAGVSSTVAFSAAQKGSGSVIKVTTILYGALTRQVTATTAAQMLSAKATTTLKTASAGLYAALGPVGIAMGAIAAVGATVAWAYNKQTKESKELKDSTQALSDSYTDSAKTQSDNASRAKSQNEENVKLKESIFALAAEENKSVEQKALLSQKTEELNGKISGLGLAYDAETNSLNMSNEQAQKRIDMQAKIQAGAEAEERLVELAKQRQEAEKKKAEAQEAVNAVNEKTFYWNSELKNSETALGEAESLLTKIKTEETNARNTAAEGEKAKTEELKQKVTDMVNQGKIDYESLSEGQKTAFDSMKAQYDSIREAATNSFEQIQQKQAVSTEQMIENLTKNAEATSNWATNIAELSKRGIDDGLIAELEKMGPAGAQQAQELVNQSDEKLKQLSDTYKKSGATATASMSKAIGEGSEPIVAEFEKTAQKSMTSFKKQFEGSELQQIGKDVNAGIAKGLGVNVGEIQEAAKNSANKLDESYKHALGIHSPSRVMIENGGFVVSGLVQGINQNQNSVTSTMNNLAQSVQRPFDNLPDTMQSLGYNAMIGFNNGLSSASSTIYNTANTIANNVANTIQKALDIHSPSRVMRTIGGFVGQGLALGMEDSERYVINASDTLAQATMPDLRNDFGSAMVESSGLAAEIHLMLGGSDFRAFVDDISSVQQSSIRLEKGWN